MHLYDANEKGRVTPALLVSLLCFDYHGVTVFQPRFE